MGKRLDQIKAVAKELDSARAVEAQRKIDAQSATERLEASRLFSIKAMADLRLESAQKMVDLWSAKLKEVMLDEYGSTGEKKFTGIGNVVVTSRLKYDPAKAVDWRIHNGKAQCLSIKKAPFKVEAVNGKLNFVAAVESAYVKIKPELELGE